MRTKAMYKPSVQNSTHHCIYHSDLSNTDHFSGSRKCKEARIGRWGTAKGIIRLWTRKQSREVSFEVKRNYLCLENSWENSGRLIWTNNLAPSFTTMPFIHWTKKQLIRCKALSLDSIRTVGGWTALLDIARQHIRKRCESRQSRKAQRSESSRFGQQMS